MLIVMVNIFAATVDFITYRNSRPEVYCKLDALKNFAKVHRKTPVQSYRPATFLKSESSKSVFL